MVELYDDFKNRKGFRKLNSTRQLRDMIYKWLISDITSKGIGISDIVEHSMKNLAEEIYITVVANLSKIINIDDVKEVFYSHHRNQDKQPMFSFKANNYNLNLLSTTVKIKIFLGTNAIIARENYNMSRQYFNDNKYIKNSKIYDCGLYRIELYPLIHGMTPTHIASKIKISDHDTAFDVYNKINNIGRSKNLIEMLNDMFLQYIIAVFYNPETHQAVYPVDCNTGNFIVTKNIDDYLESKCSIDQAFVCIDWDHISISCANQMIHTVAWMWFCRIFDLDSNNQFMTNDITAEYRRHRTLFSAIEEFKKEFYTHNYQLHLIEKYGGAFAYEVPESALNNSLYLKKLVQEEYEKRKQ